MKLETGHSVCFWELTESIGQAEHLLHFIPEDRDEYERLRIDKRRREWLASRLCLRNGLGCILPVGSESSGKPMFISNSEQRVRQSVSFSHALPVAGAVLHPSFAGIDIQGVDDRILRIRERFASAEELDAAKNSASEADYLTMLWAIKEAVFKVYGEDLPFAEGIRVAPFDPKPGSHDVLVKWRGGEFTHELRTFRVADLWVALVTK